MTVGNENVGMLACNWLRLDVKEGEQVPNVKIYSVFEQGQAEKIV